MKEKYITITGMNHYYGLQPFSVGKKLKCIKEKDNAYDSDAIKVVMKEIGTVGYVANNPYTAATGTLSASRIYDKVKKKFVVEVMFITSSKVICKVVEGLKEKDKQKNKKKQESDMDKSMDSVTQLEENDNEIAF